MSKVKRGLREGGREGGFKTWVYCAVLCVYVLLSVLCIQHRWFRKCFLTKTHFIRYILKVLQKTSEVSLSLLLFFLLFFSWIWWPVLLFGLPLQLKTCQMNNHYFNRSYSKALRLQKTWYDIQHLLHLYNVIQQCIESSDLNL